MARSARRERIEAAFARLHESVGAAFGGAAAMRDAAARARHP